jgi:transcriptional regulator with XRE-family HTH domain
MKDRREQLRKAAGLSLIRFAQKTGISRSKLSLWERGEGRLRSEDLANVATVLVEELRRTPRFTSEDEIQTFLTEEN